MGFLDDYEPVEDRIRKFYDEYPDGRITTTLLEHSEGTFITHAAVYRPDSDVPWATGLAEEHRAQSGVNANSPLENCETSAIGRALANAGYAAKGKRPSREEMAKVPAPTAGNPDWKCPECGSPVLDQLEAHFSNDKLPAFKCSNGRCEGGGKKKTGGNWPWATWNVDFFAGGEPVREDYEPGVFPPGEEPF